MITYEWLYILAGAAFCIWSLLSLADRRWGNAGFWALLAASFLLGSHVSDLVNGCWCWPWSRSPDVAD